jgi:hypothetical protein
MKTEKINDIIQKLIVPFLLVISTSVGIYNSVLTNDLEKKSKEIQNTMDTLRIVSLSDDIKRKDLDFNRSLKFRLFDEVKAAIKSQDVVLQKTTFEFVSQMLSDDEAFRDALLKTIENSPNVSLELKSEISQNLKNDQLYKDQQQEIGNRRNKVRIDIFYLEETKGLSYPIAEAISKKLDSDKYEVRVRILSKLTNAKSGYQISRNEIRYEEGESEIANEIKQKLDSELNEQLALRKINYHTPSYISVFISGNK